MLLSFRVANFRSIRDEQGLSFRVPSSVSNSAELMLAREGGWDPTVSTVAGIYGANASGKSNVIDALSLMRSVVVGSFRRSLTRAGSEIPVEPFALDRVKQNEPSEFEVVVRIDGITHQYGFRADRARILAEWLYAWPHGRRQTWFERDSASDEDDFYFGKGFSGQNQAIVKLTPVDRLFITAAAERNHSLARRVLSWFSRNLVPVGRRQTERDIVHRFRYLSRHGPPALDHLTDLLKIADLGISGIEVVEGSVFRANDGDSFINYEPQFTHAGEDDEDIALPLRAESRGTLAWFLLGERMLKALEQGSALLVDELDSSLHPRLAAQAVRMFQDPAVNPRQAQLVFTAHDTSMIGNLLGEPSLRRDQVWLTEKDQQGATHLYPLSDFKPRKLENLERGYLQGRYGAVPIVDQLEHLLASKKSDE